MSESFLKIVNMSISASWLVLAVLLLRLVLKKAPKWISVLLWGFVAIRLICPFSIESMLSLIPSSETISPEIMMDWTPEISTGIETLDKVVNPIISTSFAPKPYASANPLQILIPVLGNLWLLGILVMLMYTAASYILLRRKVSTAVLLRNNIFQSEYVDSPFVLGIIKPKIYLPFQIDGQNLEHVIAHETSHIRRKDHWWKPVGFLLLALHWFNPFMWLGYVLLCRDIELACDEKVIKEMDSEHRANYTAALVACSVGRRSIAACPLAFGEVGVKARVKSVMNYKKPAFWIIIAAMIICTAVAVCFLTNPKVPSGALPNIHSHTYVVEEVTYECGMYSFTVVAGENAPIYAITEDMTLASQMEVSEEGIWAELGKLEEMTLTKENFDDLFKAPGHWADHVNAKNIRKNTANAWQLIYNQEVLYYVLQQKNGDLYLAYGYTGFSSNDGNYAHIRWLYKLAIDTTGLSGMVAKSGEHTVPMISFTKGTAIAEYVDSLHWLTINPSEDETVPFTTWQDGKEVRGHYTAVDAETFKSLKHFIPSGLDPQTYLFQNADPSRTYIVLMTFSMEADGEVYAFGAKFDGAVSSVGGVSGPNVTYGEVKLTETVSDVQESSYKVSAGLPATDLSAPGQILADRIVSEWNIFDSMTQQQQLVSSHLWGTVYIYTDTWSECAQAIGIPIVNPLASIGWLSKTGYIGIESTDPSIPLTHVKATAYATQSTGRKLSEISVTAGYNSGHVRITLTATVSVNGGTFSTGSVCHGYATYEESRTVTGSGAPVLVVTTNEANNTGYYNGDYFDPVAYWVKGNTLYTLRIFADAAHQAEIQDTLAQILAEI